MYYTVDAIAFVMVVVIFFYIQMIPKEEEKASIFKVLREVSTPIFAMFSSVMLIYGIIYSLIPFYFIYAQNFLGAPSSMIGR